MNDEFMQNTKIPEQKFVNEKEFPLVFRPKSQVSEEGFSDWLKSNKTSLREKLKEHGAILFRDCPVNTPDKFEQMLENSEFVNMPYVGGAAPRKQVTANRVITANEAPSSEKIPFHHEMAQIPNPPSYVFFYCDIPAKKGGYTGILHSNEIYRKFVELSPSNASKIEELGVKYVRIMPDIDDHSSPIGRSWRSTFQTESKADAEKKMQEMGMEWEWLTEGALKTTTAVLPAIRSDRETGLKTFYNSIVAAYMGWDDSRNNRKQSVMTSDGYYMDESLMVEMERQMDQLAVKFPWQKGDVLWLNNNLVLHSRYPFEGERKILAAIAMSDHN